MVPVCVDFLEKIADTRMRPIVSKSWHYVSHDIASRDGAIDIRNDNFGPIVPQENLPAYLLLALQSTLHTERDQIDARLEAQRLKLVRGRH